MIKLATIRGELLTPQSVKKRMNKALFIKSRDGRWTTQAKLIKQPKQNLTRTKQKPRPINRTGL